MESLIVVLLYSNSIYYYYTSILNVLKFFGSVWYSTVYCYLAWRTWCDKSHLSHSYICRDIEVRSYKGNLYKEYYTIVIVYYYTSIPNILNFFGQLWYYTLRYSQTQQTICNKRDVLMSSSYRDRRLISYKGKPYDTIYYILLIYSIELLGVHYAETSSLNYETRLCRRILSDQRMITKQTRSFDINYLSRYNTSKL